MTFTSLIQSESIESPDYLLSLNERADSDNDAIVGTIMTPIGHVFYGSPRSSAPALAVTRSAISIRSCR